MTGTSIPRGQSTRWPRSFDGLRALVVERHEAKVWRTLPNGIVILRREWAASRVVTFWAFLEAVDVARWGHYKGTPRVCPSGHVLGDYSRVQGPDADCATFSAWRSAVEDHDRASQLTLDTIGMARAADRCR